MNALTECWYTRRHKPISPGKRNREGIYYSECRHCFRPIMSWDKQAWHLEGGFNIMRDCSADQTPFLILVDTRNDVVVARHAMDQFETREELDEFISELEAEHGLKEPGCPLVLRESGKSPFKKRGRAAPARPAEEAPAAEAVAAPEPPKPAPAADADRITGLPGRSTFEKSFDHACHQAREANQTLAVAFCDIADLELVNRVHGMVAGDGLIRQIASELSAIEGCDCHISRTHGLEFAMLLRGRTAQSVRGVLGRIKTRLGDYEIAQGSTTTATFRCGVADIPASGDPRLALRAADEALRRAKGRTAGSICIGSIAA